MPYHSVLPGECISSIAADHGLAWQQVWDDPENAELKETRKNPNILFPGDLVFVPEKKVKQLSGATRRRHRFVKKGVPAVLRLQVFDGIEPRKNQEYALVVDGQRYEGTTDGDGVLEQPISPKAVAGELTIGADEYRVTLEFGHLDPLTQISGLQARLNNLGFDCGPVSGDYDENTGASVLAFQHRFGLEETGEPDEATLAKLEELHDTVSQIPDYQPKGGAS